MAGFVSSLICAIIAFGMALLQLSLTFGAPLGEYALGGLNKILPTKMRPLSGALSAIFTFVGLTYMQIGNIIYIGLNSVIVNLIIIIFTLFLASAILFNGILTKSKKEKYVMTPFSIITFVFSVIALIYNLV